MPIIVPVVFPEVGQHDSPHLCWEAGSEAERGRDLLKATCCIVTKLSIELWVFQIIRVSYKARADIRLKGY